MSLLRYKKDLKILSADAETVCLSLLPNNIQLPYSFGWTYHEGNKKIFEREDWLMWPDLVDRMNKWGKGAIAVTHWTEEEYLRRAQPPEPILDEFEKYLFNPEILIIGANFVNFDQYLINIWRRELGRKTDWSFCNRIIDIQILSKAAHLGIQPPKIGTDEWMFFNIKMSNYHKKGLKTNLAFMCKEFDVEYRADLHHVSALYDVFLTNEIFRKQIQKLDLSI